MTYTGNFNGRNVSPNDMMYFRRLLPDQKVSQGLSATGNTATGLCYRFSNSIIPIEDINFDKRAVTGGDGSGCNSKQAYKQFRKIQKNKNTPKIQDRQDLFNHRRPKKISDDFLRAWNISAKHIAKIREAEFVLGNMTIYINNLPLTLPHNLEYQQEGL